MDDNLKRDRFGVLISILLFIFLVLSIDGYSNDDAAISYRYAKNLAEGYGLVYNPGLSPVEGYTNFLWTILLSWVYRLKLPLLESGAFLSALFSILLILFVGVWGRRQRRVNRRFSISYPMLAIAVFPPVAFWALSGMETALFTWLLVTASILISLEMRRNRSGYYSGFVWGLAVLTRPEGILFAVIIILLSWMESKESRHRASILVRRLSVPVLFFALHLLFRRQYYGLWFPNTFYAKTGTAGSLIPLGLTYLVGFMKSGGGALLFLCILAVAIRPRIQGAWTVLVTTLVYIFYVVYAGGDWMPGYRFFVPILPFMIISASAVLQKFRLSQPAFGFFLSVLLLVHLGYSGFGPVQKYMTGSTLHRLAGGTEPVDVLKELGLHLREVADPLATIAVLPAGKVPYYSGLRTIDMRGLCDRHIADKPIDRMRLTMPGHHKRDPEYVLSLKPDYIVLTGAIPKKDIPIGERAGSAGAMLDRLDILALPEFQECYEPVRIPMEQGEKDLYYFRRTCGNPGRD